MSTPVWQGGHTYPPGSLVVPTSSGAVQQVQPDNAGFETGDLTSWSTADPGRWTVGPNKYEGSYGCRISGNGLTSMASDTLAVINAGQQVSVSCKASITNAGTDDAHFQVVLQWLDASGAILPGAAGFVIGNEIQGKGGFWATSTAAGIAPAGAKKFNISLSANPGAHGSVIDVDLASYIYAFAAPDPGIVYKATQAASAKSAATEPAWPGVVGVPIVDGGVTWEGELATRVVWEASPLLLSGDGEPVWPLANNGEVHDGTIDWVATTKQITDPNCPPSKIVVMAASKIYAADKDRVPYCDTVNPLNWSDPNDAGFLPYGLQQYGSNPAAAMGIYRSNVAVFSAEGMQQWQVDEDPQVTALLDSLPLACIWHHALAPTATDLFFLASKGVRSLGISGSGVSLENGDVGMPIDVLVVAMLKLAIANGTIPIATYIPADGQYWLAFGDTYVEGVPTTSQVFVYTINHPNAPGKWSRYLFPFVIDAFTQLNDLLYVRAGDGVLYVDPDSLIDCAGAPDGSGFSPTPFDGVIWWPYLDLGSPGVDKQFVGFDIVGTGVPTISVGYNQNDPSAYTDEFVVPNDSVPGDLIGLDLMAPSFSMKVTYKGGTTGQKWQLNATNLWWQTMRSTA